MALARIKGLRKGPCVRIISFHVRSMARHPRGWSDCRGQLNAMSGMSCARVKPTMTLEQSSIEAPGRTDGIRVRGVIRLKLMRGRNCEGRQRVELVRGGHTFENNAEMSRFRGECVKKSLQICLPAHPPTHPRTTPPPRLHPTSTPTHDTNEQTEGP